MHTDTKRRKVDSSGSCVGTAYLKLSSRGFAMANVILVLVWFILAVRVGRRYQALTSNQDAVIGRAA